MALLYSVMNKNELFSSGAIQVLLVVLGCAFAIELWRDGYAFGQWLYTVLH